jgi:hypothetical protein
MVHSTEVTDYLENALPHIGDQQMDFFMEVSPNGKEICTGGYNFNAHVIDTYG